MPVSGSLGYRSGRLNNPTRVLLNNRDCAWDLSYATVLRTGDPDFLGNPPLMFDDTRTLIFAASKTSGSSKIYGQGIGNSDAIVTYPLMFPVDYPLTLNGTGSAATPNVSSSITLKRPVFLETVGEELNYLPEYVYTLNHPTGGESISPFDETRVYLDNNPSNPFYWTGSNPRVLPNLASKLANKISLTIPLNPVEETSVFWSTGTLPHGTPYANRDLGLAAGINPGISYFNWDRRVWEIIGDTTTGSNVDYLNRDNAVRTGSLWAFPNGLCSGAFSDKSFIRTAAASGYPSNFAGFPLSTKFNATGSSEEGHYGQLLQMSKYINHPFMVEKIVFEFTGSVNTPLLQGAGSALFKDQFPSTTAFFILNQFETHVSRSVETGETFYADESEDEYYVNRSGPFHVTREKDLVAFGTITRSLSRTGSNLAGFEHRDLTLVGGTNPDGNGGITGSFRLEFSASAPGIYPNALGPIVLPRVTLDQRVFVGNPDGGRNLFGDSSGRSYIASVVGAEPTGSAFDGFTTTTNQQYVQPYKKLIRESPYILLPTDRLIFGFSNQQTPLPAGAHPSRFTERNVAETQRVVLAPGPSKVTFFGSLIARNGPLVSETSNDPLISDAIHEPIQEGSEPLDEFQVEPFYTYSGSYIDNVMGGKMLMGTRRLVGSCARGTQGATGSLLRGRRFWDSSELYYDSLMPAVSHYFRRYAGTSRIFSTKNIKRLPVTAYYFSGAMSIVNSDTGDVSEWNADSSLPFPYRFNPPRVIKDDAILIISASSDDKSFEGVLDYEDLKDALFGVGVNSRFNNLFKTPGSGDRTQRLIDRKNFGSSTGFRYGIMNTSPMLSSAVFRYDKFGQLRDMLEQRLDSRFYCEPDESTEIVGFADDGRAPTESPIVIIFVDEDQNVIKAEETVSQNLSVNSTSSLPYFDGEPAVDRSDDPNKKVMIQITDLGVS